MAQILNPPLLLMTGGFFIVFQLVRSSAVKVTDGSRCPEFFVDFHETPSVYWFSD